MAQRETVHEKVMFPVLKPVQGNTKRLALWTPSILASLLLAPLLIGPILWLLAFVLHHFHQMLDKVIDPIAAFSPVDLWRYIRDNPWAQLLSLCLTGTLAISLYIESYRIGWREAFATNVRLSTVIARTLYWMSRAAAEVIWHAFGLVLSVFSREGLLKYVVDRIEELKERLAEIK